MCGGGWARESSFVSVRVRCGSYSRLCRIAVDGLLERLLVRGRGWRAIIEW